MQMERSSAASTTDLHRRAGNVGESSNMNVAFITADGTLKHPKFDHILRAARRCACRAGEDMHARDMLKGVEVCDVPWPRHVRARDVA